MRPLNAPRKQETPLADGRLDALVYLSKGLGVRHEVVCALSALEAITRRVSLSLCVRSTAPANRRRRLRMVVSTLSCALLRALAYGMRWSVRCRRWKPMIRRRNLWCAIRSLAKCSLPRVHVTHPCEIGFDHLGFSMRNFRANGAASISYSSGSMAMRVGPTV